MDARPYRETIARLRAAGLRPTRQRLALAKILFSGHDRHISAEQLHEEALAAGGSISLATIYNSLRQFTEAGLLREVAVDPGRAYYDTNTRPHHHFYFEDSGQLADIPSEALSLPTLPQAPEGTEISQVNVTIRVTKTT